MKNRIAIIFISVFLIASSILSYFCYKNYEGLGSFINTEKSNKTTHEKKIEELDKKISDLNNEKEAISDKIKSISEEAAKLSQYENFVDTKSLIFELDDYYLSFINLKIDNEIQKKLKGDSSNIKNIETTYFDNSSVNSKVIAERNETYVSLKTSFDATNKINEKVAELSHVLKKREGMIKLLDDTNFFFRDRAAKGIAEYKSKYSASFKPEDFSSRVSNILNLKSNAIGLYDNILYAANENLEFINNLRENQISEVSRIGKLPTIDSKNNNSGEIESQKNSMIFALDTISSNINYLNGYNILDRTVSENNKNIVLRYLFDNRGRILIIQEKSTGVANLYYFGSDGMPFAMTNLKQFEITYLNKNNKKDLNIINKALKYNNPFKNILSN
ncbi:hypothetical protein HMPREF9225_1438 [Peptoniphilus duerdenii ATCC BAA-1640]|uniref:Uncharacterized protein n=1 Tax=Peptoniphilus duerdenii ATCC BAA-1640 TaxID=862517 RepID=E0NMP9_9FIRM|nr:hypothetical protein [Peptoniphilus duerdenii]EFM24867.1 hypothetical protein HMPREF9225_1438 [Peptoniphilus duerdenii ATCC BAA-1640]